MFWPSVYVQVAPGLGIFGLTQQVKDGPTNGGSYTQPL